MKKKLKDIAQIQTGIYAKPAKPAQVYYIQARHFDKMKEFIPSINPELKEEEKLEKHYLHVGDVLVAAKGYDNFAITCKGIIKPSVASSMFIILRIRDKKQLLPDFLRWFINHPKTRAYLKSNSKGTALPSITKKTLGDLVIPIISLKKQEKIFQVHELVLKEKQIKEKIETLNDKIIEQKLLNVIK